MIRIIAIILILLIFIKSLFSKITNFNSTLISIQNKQIPFPVIALLTAIILQSFGIFSILSAEFSLIQQKYTLYGKLSLVIFTMLANYFYHNIFTMDNQMNNFLKNMGLIGGILLI